MATSRDDFEALIRRAGLTIPAHEVDDVFTGWGMVEPMLDRLRAGGRGREIEPAHIFRPDVFGTENS